MEKNLSKYGQAFQITTLSLFFKNKTFTNKIKDIILPEYFDNKYTKWLCEKGLVYLSKYNNFSREDKIFDDLKIIIEKEIPANSQNLYKLALENIKTADLSNREFVEEEVEKFCFTKHALLKIKEQENNILTGNFDKAREVAFTAYKPIAAECEEMDLKEDFQAAVNEILIHKPIPTPFETFNKNAKGGPGIGDLVIVGAASSLGKTAFLTATARHVAILGYNVLYFSLETKNTQLMSRALAGLTGVQQELLGEHSQLIESKIKETKGTIKFIRYKATQARVASMKLKIEELKARGFFPDLIIVDGLNQVKLPPGKKVVDNNEKFEYLAEELRDLGTELMCPIYAAFQSNRGGFNVDYADEQNIGKAIEVYQVADLFIMLTQSIPMLEKGEAYVQLLKNRLGRKGITIRVSYDPNLGMFTELEEIQRSVLLTKNQKTEMITNIGKITEKIEQYKNS